MKRCKIRICPNYSTVMDNFCSACESVDSCNIKSYPAKLIKTDSSGWVKFCNDQYPRKGEIIVVKGDSIFPRVLSVKSSTEFYYLNDESTKLAFHGLTHWKLLDSPYK